jgi:acetyl-CoA carboxylase alpha subunit
VKVSNKKLDLVDNIIEEWKNNMHNNEEIIFDCVRELLQQKTIGFLTDLYGYTNEEEIN